LGEVKEPPDLLSGWKKVAEPESGYGTCPVGRMLVESEGAKKPGV